MQSWPVEEVRGVATADPLIGAERPEIRVTSHLFAIEEIAETNHGVTSLTAFNGALLSMSFRDGREQHTLGSAVLVHPGLAITAKHVIEDWLPALVAGDASAVCQAPRAEQTLLWDVTAVHRLLAADLALVALRYRTSLPPRNEFYVAQITTRFPRTADAVFLAGFTAEAASLPISSEMRIRGMVRVGVGRVIEAWPTGRDSIMLPSPSFAVDCPAFPGMSGGPVFDSSGRFLGIVSSSVDGEHLAYVSHIWPALLADINPVWPFPVGNTTLLHMGQRRGVSIHRPDAFRLAVENGEMQLRYEPWS